MRHQFASGVLCIGTLLLAVGCNKQGTFDGSKYLAEATSHESDDDGEATATNDSAEVGADGSAQSVHSMETNVPSANVANTMQPDKVAKVGTESAAKPGSVASLLKAAKAEIKKRSDGQISEVHLRSADVTDAMAKELSQMPKLVKLTINNSTMTNEGWSLLSALKELQHLDLRGCAVNNEQFIAAVKGMPKLRAVRLNGKSGMTEVDDDGLQVLANCPELKALALDHLWVSADGLAYLKGNSKISELYLAGTLVEDDAMDVIAELKALRKLRIALTSVSGEGIEKICQMPIEDLDASECSQLFDEAMSSIGKMEELRKLNLFKVVVSDIGVEKLASLNKLQWLNLDQTPCSDEGLAFLQGLGAMEFLHLGSTAVTDDGMSSLLEMKKLKNLIVTRTAVTEAGVKRLQEALPQVKIQLKYVEGQ